MTTTTPEAPPREPRCRMHNKLGNPCSNPALDPDPNAVQICVSHAARVMALVNEHRKATTARRAR